MFRAALARPSSTPSLIERLLRAPGAPVRLICATVMLSGLLLAADARADASVLVEVKRSDGGSADGTVRLSKGETRLQCVTAKGRCEIKNVPGGVYSVEFEQAGKPAGKAKTVMIPPAGEVKLIVAAN